LVEQRTENPRVGGSNPPLGTILYKDLFQYLRARDLAVYPWRIIAKTKGAAEQSPADTGEIPH
jgi:hypothetical protein